MDRLILVANPGSSSRKYAIYNGSKCLVELHFELDDKKIICTVTLEETYFQAVINIANIKDSATVLFEILDFYNINISRNQIEKIAVRVVAPSSYFQVHRVLDARALEKLKQLESSAKIHISATLNEISVIARELPDVPLIGISDSAFHITKPEHLKNYGINTELSDKFDIKRFGYHGISIGSVVNQFRAEKSLAERLVVCHLGSGASVVAVKNGKSIDSTMGFSPLEGLIMATRSGSIDPTAVIAIKAEYKFNDNQIEEFLNKQSGLLGISQISPDLREILKEANDGNAKAKLAVKMYVSRVQQAIAQMTASLGGVDALVFTGTVGERSRLIRRLVVADLMFLGFHLSSDKNHQTISAKNITKISATGPSSIYVVPSREDQEMARLAEIIR